jgi:hypothetical protein
MPTEGEEEEELIEEEMLQDDDEEPEPARTPHCRTQAPAGGAGAGAYATGAARRHR